MSTVAPASPRSRGMKTRDKIKYAFAGVLALMTVVAIGGLMLARHERQKSRADQEAVIQQTLLRYGQNGGLPDKVKLPDPETASAARPQ